MSRHRIMMCMLASMLLPWAPAGPALAQQVSSPAISRQKLEQLIEFVSVRQVRPVREVIARGLGLTHPFMTRSVRLLEGSIRHGLAIGESDPHLIFLRVINNSLEFFLTDRRHYRLLAAGRMQEGGSTFTPVPVSEARAQFEAELRRWEAEPVPNR